MPSASHSPYVTQLSGSLVETSTVLSQLLRPHGYSSNTISDLSNALFVENERQNICDAASIHLVAIKKMLLYAIPVIAPPNSTIGITLTSQVATPAIQYDAMHDAATDAALATDDKFRLLGVAFPNRLINHLPYRVFPQKYRNKIFSVTSINLSYMKEIDIVQTQNLGELFIVKSQFYEDTTLFNQINVLIAERLLDELSVIMKVSRPMWLAKQLPELEHIAPFKKLPYIDLLNEALTNQINLVFTMSFYEALQSSGNWQLYDQIKLLGFESPEVSEQIQYLSYVKKQNVKVQSNKRQKLHQELLQTRAEKICREKFPYFFDFMDHRAIFTRFTPFTIEKLPSQQRNEVSLLLKKDLDAQEALLRNKCEHLQHASYQALEPFIDFNSLDNDQMYKCKLCSYPLVCVHTVELFDSIAAIPSGIVDSSDQHYRVRQSIITKFKALETRRTGNEDTESMLTYYCKHCGGELGKSDDIIQASIKTRVEASTNSELDPNETTLFLSVNAAVSQHMNSQTIPFSKRAAAKRLFEECRDEVMLLVRQATKREEKVIDLLIRYFAQTYAIAGLIAINTNIFKSKRSALISSNHSTKTEVSLKDEFVAALKIIQSNAAYKRIAITNDKIKALLLSAYRHISSKLTNESMQIQRLSSRAKLILNIESNPLIRYITKMFYRFTNTKRNTLSRDAIFKIAGIDLTKKPPLLFTNIFEPKVKQSSDDVRYLLESYQSLVKYTKTAAPSVSSFILDYEHKRQLKFKLRRTVPILFLQVKNSREYDFDLEILEIAYCKGDSDAKAKSIELVRPHRWDITRNGSKLTFTCKFCKVDISKANKSNNARISTALDTQMERDAFFELYTISCPIKDAHVFHTNSCAQCGVTREQLAAMDLGYHQRYARVYQKYRDEITSSIVASAKKIQEHIQPLSKLDSHESEKPLEKVDMIKLESVATNLGKLFSLSDLQHIGVGFDGKRSLEIVQSYVRLFYSHYVFARNASIEMKSHADPDFFAWIKKTQFNTQLSALPKFPNLYSADRLLLDLFEIMFALISKSKDELTKTLVRFLLTKIVTQDQRRKEYNYAKLKSVSTGAGESFAITVTEEEKDEEEGDAGMFDGYDISFDDLEDNANGET